MKSLKIRLLGIFILLVSASISSLGQAAQKNALACSARAWAALKPLPELKYQCRADEANDYDEKILSRPERIRAIKDFMKGLELFNGNDWWETATSELNVCDFVGKPDLLGEEEKRQFEGGEYFIRLMGNDRVRLVLASDPCYQTGFNGSNAFLLYRNAGRISVSQVLDGYFSRADNSVWINSAILNAKQLVEIETSTGGLSPYVTNYYFVIDRRSGKALPKNLFKDGRRLTNKITSAMILGEPDDADFPAGSAALDIIKRNKLARTFNIYEDDAEGTIDDHGRALKKIVYRWTGRFYVRAR
ncbi:MAG TPA: hypothetical protein VM911_00565 [Pyrinomonadaceae bacterium]|jgi:hypothetical protein|nr:hypothetical protein [Pyrinomonadaceae bacterium]